MREKASWLCQEVKERDPNVQANVHRFSERSLGSYTSVCISNLSGGSTFRRVALRSSSLCVLQRGLYTHARRHACTPTHTHTQPHTHTIVHRSLQHPWEFWKPWWSHASGSPHLSYWQGIPTGQLGLIEIGLIGPYELSSERPCDVGRGKQLNRL